MKTSHFIKAISVSALVLFSVAAEAQRRIIQPNQNKVRVVPRSHIGAGYYNDARYYNYRTPQLRYRSFYGADPYRFNNGFYGALPYGSFIPMLPPGAMMLNINGRRYYEDRGMYYLPRYRQGVSGFEVINPEGIVQVDRTDDETDDLISDESVRSNMEKEIAK